MCTCTAAANTCLLRVLKVHEDNQTTAQYEELPSTLETSWYTVMGTLIEANFLIQQLLLHFNSYETKIPKVLSRIWKCQMSLVRHLCVWAPLHWSNWRRFNFKLANLLFKTSLRRQRRARQIIASNHTFSPTLLSGPVLQLRQQWAEDKNATLAWLKGLDREVWWERSTARGLQTPQHHSDLLGKAGFSPHFCDGKNVCLSFCCQNETIWTDKVIRFRIR